MIQKTLSWNTISELAHAIADNSGRVLSTVVSSIGTFFQSFVEMMQEAAEASGLNMGTLITKGFLDAWSDMINHTPIMQLANFLSGLVGGPELKIDAGGWAFPTLKKTGLSKTFLNGLSDALQTSLGNTLRELLDSMKLLGGEILEQFKPEWDAFSTTVEEILRRGRLEWSQLQGAAGKIRGEDEAAQSSNESSSWIMDLVSTALGGLSGIAETATSMLGGLAGTAGSMMVSFGPLAIVAFVVLQVMQGLFAIIGPAINGVLVPLFGFLQAIGAIVGQMLLPIFNALAPTIAVVTNMLATVVFPLL